MDDKIKLALIAAGVLVAVYLVKKPGAASDIGEDIGGAIVDAAGGVATGVIDGISTGIGIPTTSQTITDGAACKIYMNKYGVLEASLACSAPAFASAIEPVEVITGQVSDAWDWLGSLFTPSPSDYKPRPSTGAFDRQ